MENLLLVKELEARNEDLLTRNEHLSEENTQLFITIEKIALLLENIFSKKIDCPATEP